MFFATKDIDYYRRDLVAFARDFCGLTIAPWQEELLRRLSAMAMDDAEGSGMAHSCWGDYCPFCGRDDRPPEMKAAVRELEQQKGREIAALFRARSPLYQALHAEGSGMPVTDQKAIILVRPARYGDQKTVIALSQPNGELLRYYEHPAIDVVETSGKIRTLHREAIEDGWNGASVRIDPAGGLGWALHDMITDGEFGLQDVKVESLNIERPPTPEESALTKRLRERFIATELERKQARAEEDKALLYWRGQQWGDPAAPFRLQIELRFSNAEARDQKSMRERVAAALLGHINDLVLDWSKDVDREGEHCFSIDDGATVCQVQWSAGVPLWTPPLVVKAGAISPEKLEQIKNMPPGGVVEMTREEFQALHMQNWKFPPMDLDKKPPAAPSPAPAPQPQGWSPPAADTDHRLGSARFEPPPECES